MFLLAIYSVSVHRHGNSQIFFEGKIQLLHVNLQFVMLLGGGYEKTQVHYFE